MPNIREEYDVIVVGAGFAGSVMARCFAEDEKKVLVIDKRNHIGGNMHENIRDNGVRVHTGIKYHRITGKGCEEKDLYNIQWAKDSAERQAGRASCRSHRSG